MNPPIAIRAKTALPAKASMTWIGSHQLWSIGTKGSLIWYENVEPNNMSTDAIGAAMDPKTGLGTLYCNNRKSPIMNQAKKDKASKGVPSGKKPHKTARCMIDNPCKAKPVAALHKAIGALLVINETRKKR